MINADFDADKYCAHCVNLRQWVCQKEIAVSRQLSTLNTLPADYYRLFYSPPMLLAGVA
jgi:hypothetical protein